jgi:hypothetical protein
VDVLHPAGTSSPLLVKNTTAPRPLSRLHACQATAEPPAGAIEGSRGELRVRSAAHQTELASTFPSTYSSSPTLPSRRCDPYLAGAGAPAVGTGRRRGTPPPGAPPPPIPVQIGSYGTLALPHALPRPNSVEPRRN